MDPDTEDELARLQTSLAEFQVNVVTKRPRVRQKESRAAHADDCVCRAVRVDGRPSSRFAESDEHKRLRVVTVTSNLSDAVEHMCALTRLREMHAQL